MLSRSIAQGPKAGMESRVDHHDPCWVHVQKAQHVLTRCMAHTCNPRGARQRTNGEAVALKGETSLRNGQAIGGNSERSQIVASDNRPIARKKPNQVRVTLVDHVIDIRRDA